MVASDVVLTNSAGIHAIPIAEYVVAGVLHFLRGLDIAIDQQRRAEWNKTPFVRLDSVLREMDTVRALIVGVGGLGGAAAERLTRARGAMHRGSAAGGAWARRPGSSASWRSTSSTPSCRRTTSSFSPRRSRATPNGLLTAERLDLLPPSAIVVNVARGALLDEDALAERLRDGRLRGGGSRRLPGGAAGVDQPALAASAGPPDPARLAGVARADSGPASSIYFSTTGADTQRASPCGTSSTSRAGY